MFRVFTLDGEFQCWCEEFQARRLIREGHATVTKHRGERRIVLIERSQRCLERVNGSTIYRTSDNGNADQKFTYDEPLNEMPSVLNLKRLKDGSFQRWHPKEGFPRRRFNPDHVRMLPERHVPAGLLVV